MSKFCDKSFPITCNKSIALCFCLLALLCLSICPGARAWTTNAFGYYALTYDELDTAWGDFYEDHTGEPWPGLSEWCNTLPEIGVCFGNPHPHITGLLNTGDVTFASTNGFLFASLGPYRNYLCDLQGTLTPIDQEVPTYSMIQVADKSNLVDTVVESLANIPNTVTNDANFPWRIRRAQLVGMQSRVIANASALLFHGVSMEVKTVPYGWSGYWAGWSVSVCELIDNGVNPSVFGSLSYMCDEQNVAWISDTRSIFDAFSNITVNVKHEWRSPNGSN